MKISSMSGTNKDNFTELLKLIRSKVDCDGLVLILGKRTEDDEAIVWSLGYGGKSDVVASIPQILKEALEDIEKNEMQQLAGEVN